MQYVVCVEETGDGFSVWCPGLPGCWSQGRTEEEALTNITDAITAYLETARELAASGQRRTVEIPV